MTSTFRLLIAGVLSLAAGAAAAVEVDAHRWSVEFHDDFVILRAPATVDHDLMQATMKALVEAGSERIVLQKLDPTDKFEIGPGVCLVQFGNGRADITASVDVPKKFRQALSDRLKKMGAKEIEIKVVGDA